MRMFYLPASVSFNRGAEKVSRRPSTHHPPRPLPVLLSAIALEAEIVVAVTADFAAITESRRPRAARTAPTPVRRVETMNDPLWFSKKLLLGGCGHGASFAVHIK